MKAEDFNLVVMIYLNNFTVLFKANNEERRLNFALLIENSKGYFNIVAGIKLIKCGALNKTKRAKYENRVR